VAGVVQVASRIPAWQYHGLRAARTVGGPCPKLVVAALRKFDVSVPALPLATPLSLASTWLQNRSKREPL
jgi:hypothetical protein